MSQPHNPRISHTAMKRRLPALVLVLVLVCLVPSLALAGPASDRLKSVADQILKVLADPVYKDAAKASEQRDILKGLVDQIFDFQVRDFNTYAVALHGKPTATAAQQDWALAAIRKPVPDAERFGRVWERVRALDGAYEMAP